MSKDQRPKTQELSAKTQELTTALATIMMAVPKLPQRRALRDQVALLLEACALDPKLLEPLTGDRPLSRLGLSAKKPGTVSGVLNPLFKFIWLEYLEAGDQALTTIELASQELGISPASVRVRLSMGSGTFTLKRAHPSGQHPDDRVTVSRVAPEDQPQGDVARSQALDQAARRLSLLHTPKGPNRKARGVQY